MLFKFNLSIGTSLFQRRLEDQELIGIHTAFDDALAEPVAFLLAALLHLALVALGLDGQPRGSRMTVVAPRQPKL